MGPVWCDQWYPVAYLRDLDPGQPTAFTLLGRDLVLWWDQQSSRWRAFEDRCPHRLVPLSQGRINEAGQLECPYHGWSFDGAGTCQAIPQAEEGVSPGSRRASCLALPTAEGQGLLFVFAGEAGRADATPLPLIPSLEEEGDAWLIQDTFRDLPMDAVTLLENVLDVSHVNFTHHRTVGRRDNAAPVRAELLREGPDGFEATWAEGPRRGRLGSQHTTFRAPQLMWHELEAKGFARILTVVYAVPIRPGECRLFARFPFRFASPWSRRLLSLRPRWLQHVANHTVLEDDQVFLHWQERSLAAAGGSERFEQACYLPTGSDLYVKALHRWLNGPGSAPFPGQAPPPRLELPDLMDRYHSHTIHCRSCSGALRRLRQLQPLVLVALALALVASAWAGPSWSGGLDLGLAGALWLAWRWMRGKEQGLLRGSGLPPRNR
ncbi:cell death suppressor protein Lls1 [Synechococcus sp. RSCCF101]|nr:cell death suppressor protein Lls1 [Synechococcus sp. RSCCF101]